MAEDNATQGDLMEEFYAMLNAANLSSSQSESLTSALLELPSTERMGIVSAAINPDLDLPPAEIMGIVSAALNPDLDLPPAERMAIVSTAIS